MPLANTRTHFGVVARTLHWLTALLVLTAIPLGLIANGIPLDGDAQIARKTVLFSLHKTVGVTTFFVALARILWAATQPRPVAMHPDRRAETFAAATVHWVLYASLVIVPLSGWAHHAATTGFAPIWLPFGQSLPFIPIDFRVAEFFAAWHWLFTKLLAAALFLHIAGAIKHAIIDRDGTLARMVTGGVDVPDTPHRQSAKPVVTAALIWAVVIAGGSILGSPRDSSAADQISEAPLASGWTVLDGSVDLTVRQLGSDVSGAFEDWIAVVDFDPDTDSDIKGSTEVSIDIASLELGSITVQALGADFFDADLHPLATYSGTIVEDPAGDGFVVLGILDLRGVAIPVELPFEFRLDGDIGQINASTTLDRRDFGIGDSIKDEGSLGFLVDVDITLLAQRP